MAKSPSAASSWSQVLRNKMLLSIAVLLIMVLIAVGMLFIPISGRSATLDDEALARSVTAQCAMGMTAGRQAEVSAGLQKFFSGVKAGAKITTSDIGAVADKVAPTDQGVALYKIYTDCLKTQTTIMLERNGIHIAVPDASSIGRQQDDLVRQAIDEITPDTPRDKLVEIFGNPIFSGETELSPGLLIEVYRYKFEVFVYDYISDDKRVAIALRTKDPLLGQALVFQQITGRSVAEVTQDCGKVVISSNGNGRSAVCMSSHATNFLSTVYIFPSVLFTETKAESQNPDCARYNTATVDACPGFASAPALGVVMIRNRLQSTAVNATLDKVAKQFIDELDFSDTGVKDLSPDEEKAAEKIFGAGDGLNGAQLLALKNKQSADRAVRYAQLVE